jgi:tRNA modification GTPase
MVCDAQDGNCTCSEKEEMSSETIAAQATPSGRGGVAIIRISGPLTRKIIPEILPVSELHPRAATYLPFLDADKQIIDEGVALFFPNPHSFTGEDVLELQGHGGPVVVDMLLQRILSLGVRLARPGEFSERAFLNGKMDLAQAESISDLIDASSRQAAKLAMRSLQGDFSREIHAINEKIIQLRMYVEAAIDFTDEEIDFLGDEKILLELKNILQALAGIQKKAKQGSFLREGITAVIAGAPNVGKSSLLNALSGKEVAIVTDIPGTTRDVLRDYVLIDGMPMHIIDTAGLRESEDVVEQEGIRRAYLEIEKADLVLYVDICDYNCVAPENTPPLSLKIEMNPPAGLSGVWAFAELKKNNKILFIRNKIDLSQEPPSVTSTNNLTTISLSAKSTAGLDLLKQEIKKLVGFDSSDQGVYLARRRHLDALARAEKHTQNGLDQLHSTRACELAAEDLRQAHLALCEITGEFSADDLLGRIFSSFCVGK